MVQDHVIHFYHLHALDWVDVVSALKADPKKTAELAQSISDWPKSTEGYFKAVPRPPEGLRRERASSVRSPTATGGTRPTSCRRRPT